MVSGNSNVIRVKHILKQAFCTIWWDGIPTIHNVVLYTLVSWIYKTLLRLVHYEKQ